MSKDTITLAQVAEEAARATELERQLAQLDARDQELAQAIADSFLNGNEDVSGLNAEREEVRAKRMPIAAALPKLREKIAERRVSASLAFLSEWHAGPLANEAQTCEAGYQECQVQATRIEKELQRVRAQAEVHRERVQVLADVSKALRLAFALPATPVGQPSARRQPDAPIRRTSIENAVSLDNLSKAAREVVRVMSDDRVLGSPELAEAVETLLLAKPPKSPEQLNAERRDAIDRPHRDEIERVDNWLKSQLANGPVPHDKLIQRAVKARVTVQGRSELGWGQATLRDAARRVGAYQVVRYTGSDFDDRTAAEKWEADVVYWTLRPAPKGLAVPRGRIMDAIKMSALRG